MTQRCILKASKSSAGTRWGISILSNEDALWHFMTVSKDTSLPPRRGAIAPEYLEAYAEADAQAGQPNPRFKQSSIYTGRYLAVRTELVGFEALNDAELDLMIF